jgi:hypothetical protein
LLRLFVDLPARLEVSRDPLRAGVRIFISAAFVAAAMIVTGVLPAAAASSLTDMDGQRSMLIMGGRRTGKGYTTMLSSGQ